MIRLPKPGAGAGARYQMPVKVHSSKPLLRSAAAFGGPRSVALTGLGPSLPPQPTASSLDMGSVSPHHRPLSRRVWVQREGSSALWPTPPSVGDAGPPHTTGGSVSGEKSWNQEGAWRASWRVGSRMAAWSLRVPRQGIPSHRTVPVVAGASPLMSCWEESVLGDGLRGSFK